jgi:hypothetical protein
MSEADQLLRKAAARSDAIAKTYVPIDYAAANKMFRRQKAALTRAVNSGDPDAIIMTCWKAVREWRSTKTPWPDQWATWNVALSDAASEKGYRFLQLEDIASLSEADIQNGDLSPSVSADNESVEFGF